MSVMHKSWKQGLVIISDDPLPPEVAVGPSEETVDTDGFTCAVVWSGAWDQGVFDSISEGALSGASVLLVLTQVDQHKHWVKAIGKKIPMLELHP